MIIELKIPSPGESITEVELANWFVENGDVVAKDQEVGEIESEKATLPLIADQGGKIELLAEVGETLTVGSAACKIDTSVEAPQENAATDSASGASADNEAKKEITTANDDASGSSNKGTSPEIKEDPASEKKKSKDVKEEHAKVKATPLAKKMMEDEGLNVDDIINGLTKIKAKDVNAVTLSASQGFSSNASEEASREAEHKPMSQLRKKISERLVAVKNETAMLTTFNEVDMSAVMDFRKKHQKAFVEKHGIKLGFMSFFTKAVTLALKQYPNVNSMLDGEDIVSPNYCDVGIAVQTDKGLMVPVVRNAESLGLAEIENRIAELAGKARKGRISLDELSGGTFTITNGGIFGSMLSTPILNPPQSGILGMHNILERPVAIDGQVVIRPMMYIALSYDHRIIDGRDSVGFLKTVKGYIEDPVSMLFAGEDMDKMLLEI